MTLDTLTNLLPLERQARLRREYFFRLATVGVLALLILVALHAAMLIPSYAHLGQRISVQEEHLAQLAASLTASEEQEMDARLTSLKDDATYLLALNDVPSVSGALRAILAVPRPGISLSGFSYVPPGGSAPGSMVVRGTAATRDALRGYHDALTGLPGVTKTDLPIGAYAEETDIAFSITVTGSFTPPSP